MQPLSVYIHIPFCAAKCGYCDFYSHRPREGEADRYIRALKNEIALYRNLLDARGIYTVYIGGGTPSLLGTDRLLAVLGALMPQMADAKEITIEGNPESMLDLDISTLIDAGVNRFSMGVQSASDALLTRMGRIHDAETAMRAFRHLRSGGADNINLDFISSVPGENAADVEASLAMIRALQPEHVSLYSLILEEGTPFYERYFDSRDAASEERDRLHVHAYALGLSEMGYGQYEISNFAKPGRECRHNLHYWDLGEYIGIGAAACGNLGDTRYGNHRSMRAYFAATEAKRSPREYTERLMPIDRDNEYIVLGLRKNVGIALDAVLPSGATFGAAYTTEIEEFTKSGLLHTHKGRIALTDRGRDLANIVELGFFRLEEDAK